MVKRQIACVVVVLLGLVGCSSHHPGPGAIPSPHGSASSPAATPSSATPQPSGSVSSPTSSAHPTSASTSGQPTHGSTSDPSPSASSSPSYSRETLKIAIKPCVQPGQTQVLSFHSRPKMNVVVNTRYADGKDGRAHGGFDYTHATDSQGNYTLRWLVDPATPLGPADSLVGAVDRTGTGNGKGDFRVAFHC